MRYRCGIATQQFRGREIPFRPAFLFLAAVTLPISPFFSPRAYMCSLGASSTAPSPLGHGPRQDGRSQEPGARSQDLCAVRSPRLRSRCDGCSAALPGIMKRQLCKFPERRRPRLGTWSAYGFPWKRDEASKRGEARLGANRGEDSPGAAAATAATAAVMTGRLAHWRGHINRRAGLLICVDMC